MKTRLISASSTLLALVGSCLILWGCPEPRPERPDAPEWRLEVIRQASRDNAFGEVSIRAADGGAALVLFNDLEHQAVALAERGAHSWRVEYPVTQASWMGLALGDGSSGDGARLRYALSPRTVVDAEWDGRTLTETGREALGEEAFATFRATGATLLDGSDRAYRVQLDGPRALACEHPMFERCPALEARPGQRIVGSAIAAVIDGRSRPHVAFFEQQLETPGDRAVLRYAVCESERWDAFTIGPADTAGLALAVDPLGHPHFAYVRPVAGGEGQELVYGTSAAPPERPATTEGSCPEGMISEEGGCAPADHRIAAALEACGRIEVSDVPVEAPHETPDGFRCLVAGRTPELSMAAEAYARSRCEAGGAASFCALAAAFHDFVVASMTFDPLLCTPAPGGRCMDNTLQVMGVHFRDVPDDRAQALALYRQACDQGHDGACLRLASLVLSRDRDDALAYRLTRPRCEAGEGHLAACAMAVEAARASDQPGEEALRATALRRFEQRCEGGHPSACTNLGYMLVRGEGIAEDRARARTLFQRACEAGHEPACQNAREAAR